MIPEENKRVRSGQNGPKSMGRPIVLQWVCFLLFAVIGLRLVQIQVVEAGKYKQQAEDEHLKRWELKAERGTIFIKDRSGSVPIAMNSTIYNLSASPRDIDENIEELSENIAKITGQSSGELEQKFSKAKGKGYVALAKRLSADQAKEITKLKVYGLFLEAIPQREYPEGRLASHVLGFVNTEGDGQYGVEQFYNESLAGKPGALKALSTADGAPLLLPGDEQTVETPAQQGKDIVLSLDRNLQSRLEDVARAKQAEYSAKSVSVLIMDAGTGKIKAMAGSPDYNPAEYFKVTDASTFQNGNVSDAEELGSIIKVLTVATGLNEGVVNKNSTYENTGSVTVEDRVIRNATNDHGGTIDMTGILRYSLNTGVVHVLKQLGGGSINDQAEDKLYSYFYDRFRLGQSTGIDLSGESDGIIFSPDEQEGNRVRFSNMTFGQGMTSTPIQAAAALSATVNGGKYVQPSVVESVGGVYSEPKILNDAVLSAETSDNIKDMISQASYLPKREGYRIGGKTGTAQLLQEDGTYSQSRERGTTYGFIETGEGTFVVMVKVEDPALTRFAGTKTAVPIFVDTINWIVDYYQPKKLNN